MGLYKAAEPRVTSHPSPQGPCRREMEDTLSQLKFLNTLSPRGAHIPNCDRKGFYKKKQVRVFRPSGPHSLRGSCHSPASLPPPRQCCVPFVIHEGTPTHDTCLALCPEWR